MKLAAIEKSPNQGLGGGMKYAQGSRAARARLFESTSLHYVYSNPAARLPAHAGAVEQLGIDEVQHEPT